MAIYIENETEYRFPFSVEDVVNAVCEQVLDMEHCDYEAQINLLITDSEGIRMCNSEFRNIDKVTDVLSFPALEYETEGDFSVIDENDASLFDPDSGELILGDIMINVDRVLEQAENYGHSIKREFAFLVAHSMFHLCGYDHMVEEEAARMEEKQETALRLLGITRDE